MYILGISAYFHDSAAALIKDGEIIAASQEERFSRIKNDPAFPALSIEFCLKQAGITLDEVSYVTFYDKPFLKFERLIETYVSYAPQGLRSFLKAMPPWLKEKLFLKRALRLELKKIGSKKKVDLLFTDHHQSHASSAFFPSPYNDAMVLCLDGVGEWATTTLWKGEGRNLTALWQINFPHSLGLLYSAFTSFCGFKVNSGEYKLMGLAPYGGAKYVDLIYKNLIDVKEDGSFRLNMDYFNYGKGLTMTTSKFDQLFSGPPRVPESEMTQQYMDMARSIQVVIEEVTLKIVKNIHKNHGGENLCLAGGVALNCVSNGRLLREGPYKNIWVQPAPGDAGASLGAAFATWNQFLENKRVETTKDLMKGAYLGPEYSQAEINSFLNQRDEVFQEYEEEELLAEVVDQIESGKVVGWFQGRSEFGPRALGNRSILADPRSETMQSTLNLKIKKRESFRPFAPAVIEEDLSLYFGMTKKSPYMSFVSAVHFSMQFEITSDNKKLDTKEFRLKKLESKKSPFPAITHVDGSARVQTVSKETNPKFHKLISTFKDRTGCSLMINTSFNVRGEPIVNSPEDAYACFKKTDMDVLVLGNAILSKGEI